jgi:hypothetical protein
LFVPTRVVFFYFDPAKMRTPGEMGAAGTVLCARLFFEDTSLPETALKLARLIEGTALPADPILRLSASSWGTSWRALLL